MYSRTKVRRNAVNHPGFSSGSDSYNRKRSLDIAAWSRSEKRNNFSVRQRIMIVAIELVNISLILV